MREGHYPFKVLYEDNHVLVVVKPAGIPVQEDSSGDDDLLTMCKAYIKEKYEKPGDVYLGLVHRLDRPVSGPVVLARTSKAASRLSEQFRDRKLLKKYVALVEGRCTGSGSISQHVASKDKRTKIVKERSKGAKLAELNWETLLIVGKWTLLDVDLITGRKHQIRAQLSKLGYPISGDFKYGAKAPFDGRNMGLHCYALGFTHPVLKTPMLMTAAPEWRIDQSLTQRIRELIFEVKRKN